MNDLKNSSKGFLLLASKDVLKQEQLDAFRKMIEPLADDLDLKPVALCDSLEVSAVIDYSPLLTRLCVAVEALVAQGKEPDIGSAIDAQNAPHSLNARPTREDHIDVFVKGLNNRG